MALSPHPLRTRLGPSTRALVRVLLPAARAVAVSFIEYISHATLVGIQTGVGVTLAAGPLSKLRG